jgi:hypothetical protein
MKRQVLESPGTETVPALLQESASLQIRWQRTRANAMQLFQGANNQDKPAHSISDLEGKMGLPSSEYQLMPFFKTLVKFARAIAPDYTARFLMNPEVVIQRKEKAQKLKPISRFGCYLNN